MFDRVSPSRRALVALLIASCVLSACFAWSCRRDAKQPAEVPKVPSVRLYLSSTLAGAMEPCGCRKDMLGGVDHAAALIEKGKQEAPNSVVLGAGPVFFLDPELAKDKRQQDLWKAHGIAASLSEIGFAGWSPGLNDFAAGRGELAKLHAASGAALLGANLTIDGVKNAATKVVSVGNQKMGITGVTAWSKSTPLPEGVSVGDPAAALTKAKKELQDQGAKVLVALVSAQRGQALRLAETVPGFSVMVVGKPFDRGEGNDAPTPAVLVGKTLVVQAPNHLQSLAIVDLYVRGDSVSFADGTGIEIQEQRISLERRIAELKTRLAVWKERGKTEDADVQARRADLQRLEKELAQLDKPSEVPEGSFFRYDLQDVREKFGSNEQVLTRMRDYYKQVNNHNRAAFKDRKPKPLPKDKAGYVGGMECNECHEEAYEFWKTTGHASAYETLEVDFKEFNLDCVSCHVTGYDKPGGSTVTHVKGLKDVQCEACHGPGSFHIEEETEETITLTPEESVCKGCHHTPHVADDWDVKEAWKHIIGPGHGGDEVAAPVQGESKGAGGARQGAGGGKH